MADELTEMQQKVISILESDYDLDHETVVAAVKKAQAYRAFDYLDKIEEDPDEVAEYVYSDKRFWEEF